MQENVEIYKSTIPNYCI